MAFDSRCELPPINPTEVRVELIRNDITIELHVITGLISIVDTYLALGLDEDAHRAMNQARDHMRAALGLMSKLMQERRDADLNREAAEEWRAERDSRRRA